MRWGRDKPGTSRTLPDGRLLAFSTVAGRGTVSVPAVQGEPPPDAKTTRPKKGGLKGAKNSLQTLKKIKQTKDQIQKSNRCERGIHSTPTLRQPEHSTERVRSPTAAYRGVTAVC